MPIHLSWLHNRAREALTVHAVKPAETQSKLLQISAVPTTAADHRLTGIPQRICAMSGACTPLLVAKLGLGSFDGECHQAKAEAQGKLLQTSAIECLCHARTGCSQGQYF